MTDSSKEKQRKTDMDLVKLKENLDALNDYRSTEIIDMTIKKSFSFIKNDNEDSK